MDMGRYDQAVQVAQNHLEISRQIAADSPDSRKAQSRLAASYDGMGDTLSSLGRWDECLKNYEASSQIYKSLADSSPKPEIARSNWALERRKIGGVLEARGAVTASLVEYRKSLNVDRELAAADPVDAYRARDLSIDYRNLGDALLKTREIGSALQNYRQALSIDRRLMAADLRGFERHAVFGNAGAGVARLLQQREQRAVRGQKIAETLADQHHGAGLEKLLGGGVGEKNALGRADDDHRIGECVENRLVALHGVGSEQRDRVRRGWVG